jgi:hypothetical protein
MNCGVLAQFAIRESSALMHWRSAVFVPAVSALVVSSLVMMWRGVNPDSLWLDDQWVATLVKHASLSELLELRAPAPIGFILLLRVVAACFGWGHWQLQALPFLCALAQIPLIGWIAWRATGRLSLGLVAATLLSGSRTMLMFGVRVKQYTLEGLIVLILIALAMQCVQRPRTSTFALLIVAAAMAIPFSFTAAPVGLVVVNVLVLHLLLMKRDAACPPRWAIIVGCAAHAATVLLWLWLFQARQPNSLMFSYWRDHYAPVTDAAALWDFAQTHGLRFLTGAMPNLLEWLVVGVPLAVILLCCRRGDGPHGPWLPRLVGIGLLLFYSGMFVASAIELYPLGGRRTDVFSYPITILAVVAAVWAISRHARWFSRLILLVVGLYALLLYPGRPIEYPRTGGKELVEQAEMLLQDEDWLLISPASSWAFGCYGSWPVRLVPVEESTNRFVAEVARPRTTMLREAMTTWAVEPEPALVLGQLEELRKHRPHRIVYVSIQPSGGTDSWVSGALASLGYTSWEVPMRDGPLVVYELRPEE